MTTLIASVALILLPAARAHAGPLSSTPLITYNMQGATSGQDSVWTVAIGPYIRRSEIVAVQEAGATPPGVQASAPLPIPALVALNRPGLGAEVQHHRWRFGFEDYEVYFLQTDRTNGTFTGGRVNIALVTHRQADEVTAVVNPNANGRAALGVRFDNDWYFTFHGLSLGPGVQNDSAAMLASINTFVNQVPGRQWTVMGDFNSAPGSFAIPAGSTIYSTGQPTQQSGGELDYVVSSTNIQNHPVQRQNGVSSDHYAVALGALRGAAEPRETLFNSPRLIENMRYGGALQTQGLGGENGSPIVLSPPEITPHTGSDNQEWDIAFNNTDTVQLRMGQDRCIEATAPKHGSTFRMSLSACVSNVTAQMWKLVSLGNEQYQIRSVDSGLCMAGILLNAQKMGKPSPQVDLRLESCQEDDSEHWLIIPSYHPDLSSDFDVPDLSVAYDETLRGLENARTGRMLAHDFIISPNPPRTYPHGATPVPSQEAWRLHLFSGSDLLELRNEVNGLCLSLGGLNQAGTYYGVVWVQCGSAPSTLWKIVPAGENTFALQSLQPTIFGTVCLEEGPEEHPSPSEADSGIVFASTCYLNTTPTMRWFFAPFDTSRPPVEVEP